MIRRAAFLALIATALLALQGADCFAPETADQQAMACCHSMKCLPGQHSHQCCRAAATSHPPNALPQEYSVLRVPAPAPASYLALPDAGIREVAYGPGLDLKHHPPPEFYTLHSSLLI